MFSKQFLLLDSWICCSERIPKDAEVPFSFFFNKPAPAGSMRGIAWRCAQKEDLGDFRQNLRILVLDDSSFSIFSN